MQAYIESLFQFGLTRSKLLTCEPVPVVCGWTMLSLDVTLVFWCTAGAVCIVSWFAVAAVLCFSALFYFMNNIVFILSITGYSKAGMVRV